MNLPHKTSGKMVVFALLIALGSPARASTIKNTNIQLDDVSAEALVALGTFFKALDIIEKEKSYGDKYSKMVKEIRTATSYDADKQHPFLLLDKSMEEIHKKIQASKVDIPKEEIVTMVKEALEKGHKVFSEDVKEGKIKLAQEEASDLSPRSLTGVVR